MKKIFLSLFAVLTIVSAAAETSSTHIATHENPLNDVIDLESKLWAGQDLSYGDFVEGFKKLIGSSIRAHSILRIAPDAHNIVHYIEFARPYISQIEALPVSTFLLNDTSKRLRYVIVMQCINYSLMILYPIMSETWYKRVLQEFEYQLTIFIKEYADQIMDVDHNARIIMENLGVLTTKYYQEQLTPAQQAVVIAIEKEEDESSLCGRAVQEGFRGFDLLHLGPTKFKL